MNGKHCLTCPLTRAILEQQAALRANARRGKALERDALVKALRDNNADLQERMAGVVVATFLAAIGGLER